MNNTAVLPEFNFQEMVMASDGQVFTTSKKIADYFGKTHKNVLRKIKQTINDCPEEFAELNFEPADYIDKNGDIKPMYKLSKDGYMLLVMSFTGKAAMLIKIKFIQAFNWMAEQINRWKDLGEEAQHRHALKAAKSELKGRLGSQLMNGRKKEKKALQLEYEQILSLTQPKLLFVDE
ncbi:Rha family transcriptional regulator [Providencia rettgeri]|uniref:Rha family transcriptional regulator n=1 Tax=Providencia rettgeri TaxID=587 RepID=UPI0023AAF8A5|nr:Rha family transcriptional regulator [Providencia rettgeri]